MLLELPSQTATLARERTSGAFKVSGYRVLEHIPGVLSTDIDSTCRQSRQDWESTVNYGSEVLLEKAINMHSKSSSSSILQDISEVGSYERVHPDSQRKVLHINGSRLGVN